MSLSTNEASVKLYKAILRAHTTIEKNQADSKTEHQALLKDLEKIIKKHPAVLSTPLRMSESEIQLVVYPLHCVSILGNAHITQLFVEKCPRAASLRSYDQFPLHYAAHEGHLEVVKLLYTCYPEASKLQGNSNKLPLHKAVERGHVDISRFLLKVFPFGAAVDNNSNDLPLHMAVMASEEGDSNSLEMIEMLVESYPDACRTPGNHSDLPLHLAAKKGNTQIVRLLMEAYPDACRRKGKYGYFPIDRAVWEGHIQTVKTLLEYTNYNGIFEDHQSNFEANLIVGDIGTHRDNVTTRAGRPLWRQKPRHLWSLILRLYSKQQRVLLFENASNFPLLHQAIGIIPLDEVRFIIHDLNINLYTVDDSGRCSLLLAIHESRREVHTRHWNDYFKPIIQMIITKLLHGPTNHDSLYPLNKMIDHRGRYLLLSATDAGLPWNGVKTILDANMTALEARDSKTKLHPFMIAASKGKLTVAFELLRYKPDILETLRPITTS